MTPYAKSIIAFLIGVVGQAIAQGLLTGETAKWAALIIGAVTTAGVFGVKNQPAGADDGNGALVTCVLVALLVFLVLGIFWFLGIHIHGGAT